MSTPTATGDPFERPAPQPGDRELAVWLHDNLCEDEACEGWERVSSFGKRGWLDSAREAIALVKPFIVADSEVAP